MDMVINGIVIRLDASVLQISSCLKYILPFHKGVALHRFRICGTATQKLWILEA